ncbi:Peroxiredoxin [Rubellimicrobium thermophilum DSM 16684]|uniref:Alkyl hydroperoxide reductase C n=1 Tax=Rubellimicrobium thermophilum DSM 16684 TaxID=1123069 RepID=S9S3U1_9RHOB|nr:redoxin domain-containing protein [Rubellimicrobium thermophilum]EPX84865.1 Peroxiredoxin [Rubellimicrobium thermophilum DSM 16684]
MDYRFFEEARLAHQAKVPWSYRRSVRWLPRIGDIVPDFRAETNQGPIVFHDWAEGSWIVLFSHPLAFTGVCTTEIAALAAREGEFAQRGARMLALSSSSAEAGRKWVADIARIYGFHVTFPLIADPEGRLCNLFGMLHEKQSESCAIRKTLIIGPDLRIRAIFEYPMVVGRSSDEMLRVLDAIQTAEAYNLATPADWQPGDDLVLLPPEYGPPAIAPGAAMLRHFAPYLATVADPEHPAADLVADSTFPDPRGAGG